MPTGLRPVAIPLDVLFEDEHMLAINKPAGMVVHPGVGTGEDTLVHALLAHCAGGLSGVGGVERPGHRPPARQGNLGRAARRQERRRPPRAVGAVCRPASAQGIPRARVRRAAAEKRRDRTFDQPSSGAPRAHDDGRGRPAGAHRLGGRPRRSAARPRCSAAASTAAAPTRSACT